MAKSHALRAATADDDNPDRTSSGKTDNSDRRLRSLNAQVRQAKKARDVAQYEYDTDQSRKHLVVALAYLKAAAKSDGLDIASLKPDVPKTPKIGKKGDLTDLTDYVDEEIRPRVKKIIGFVDEQRKAIESKVD